MLLPLLCLGLLVLLRSQLYKPEVKMIKRLVGHQLIQQNRSPGAERTLSVEDFFFNPGGLKSVMLYQ